MAYITGISQEENQYGSKKKVTITATAGQTVFTPGFSYIPGSNVLEVFINGVKQAAGAYTESQNFITLSEGVQAGDIVEIVADVVEHRLTGEVDWLRHNYGPYPSDPSTRPNGDARVAGDEYFNTTTGKKRYFNGAIWVDNDGVSEADLNSANGSDKIGFVQNHLTSVPTTIQKKLRETFSITDFGASTTKTPAENRTALVQAISAIDSQGGGKLIIPSNIDYGFVNMDISTYPNTENCVNDVVIVDEGEGDADNSGNKAGAQKRIFFYTKQTIPAGMHDGNGYWLYGNWHPYFSINNTANLAAAGSPSRKPSDNRRASILFNNDGKSTWRLGQGTLAGATYSNEELSNFVLEHYQAPGDTLGNYAPLTIERKTGNWSIGGGTNAPQAMLSVKNVTYGYWTALFESLGTSTEIRLRNSSGSSQDVAVKNTSGDFEVVIPSLGTALSVKASSRNVSIGSNGDYRLDVADNKSSGYVSNFKNNSGTNGNVMILDSASSPGTGWSALRVFANNQTDQIFHLRGDGNAYADGSWNSGGADFAEYFEWQDGNINGEDRRGCVVALVGDKIKIAEKDDKHIVGVITTNPSFVGDSSENEWKRKWKRDDFGSIIMNSNGEKMLSDEYDPDLVYVPRSERKEWALVGLIGKVYIRKDQQIPLHWVKMRDVSESVSLYLVK